MIDPGLVSVILPCYNAEQFVATAVESLLGQTYHRLEILAIDDGSSDGTLALLESLAAGDDRIVIVHFEENQGLIAALNAGLDLARGEFIARMDADDIADPTKFEEQVAFLEGNPDTDLIGCAMREIRIPDRHPRRAAPVRCELPAGARFMGLLGTPVAHVTIVARSTVMSRYRYSMAPEAVRVEDYELFSRMLRDGVQIGNLDVPLLTRRLYDTGASLSNEREQIENFLLCSRVHFEQEAGASLPAGVHRTLTNRMDRTVTPGDLLTGLRLLGRLERRALAADPESESDIKRVADLQRADILSQALLHGRPAVRAFGALAACRWVGMLRSSQVRAYIASKMPPALSRCMPRAIANDNGMGTSPAARRAS